MHLPSIRTRNRCINVFGRLRVRITSSKMLVLVLITFNAAKEISDTLAIFRL